MLVLARNIDEKILIGDNIELCVVDIDESRRRVRIGITAPREIRVLRKELLTESASKATRPAITDQQ